jgi:hypothetical protein
LDRQRFCSVAAAVLLLPALALAHHALQAEFDINKPSRHWTGTLKSVQWINPHSRFVLDVDEAGKVTTWTFETAAPNGLRGRASARKASSSPGRPTRSSAIRARRIAHRVCRADHDARRPHRQDLFGDPNGSN